MNGPSDPADRDWDVIVIGTGIGGGTVGRALADAGCRVLFVEMGHEGHASEENGIDPGTGSGSGDPVARAVRGLWPTPVSARIDGREAQVFAPLGSGVGGSSVFYAATLERPEPHDLDDTPDRPHPTGGWPVRHADMALWFDRAEAMYAVAGEPDPLSDVACPALGPPRDPDPGDAALMARLRRNGMHPYRLHAAVRHLPDCAECFGRKCPRPCKMDGRSAGVMPALATGNAALMARTTVLALHSANGRITGVDVRRGGEALTLRAPRVVMAAGAFGTPRLLLASTGAEWPDGIGNARGLVGRHLMFHLNEMVAVWAGGRGGASKSVGFRDLYWRDGARLGMVQAMGIEARYPEILHFLRQRIGTRHRGGGRILHELARIPAAIAARALGSAKIFVGLLEDLPDPENRILFDPAQPDRVAFDYRISDELRARRTAFRAAIKHAFRGAPVAFLARAPEPNLGHPCGTARMGTDPATSVTAPDGRVHGMENLWVADAALFPTSMGVNPSLTIAALALKIADGITSGMKDGNER